MITTPTGPRLQGDFLSGDELEERVVAVVRALRGLKSAHAADVLRVTGVMVNRIEHRDIVPQPGEAIPWRYEDGQSRRYDAVWSRYGAAERRASLVRNLAFIAGCVAAVIAIAVVGAQP